MGDGKQLSKAMSWQLLPVLKPVHPGPACILHGKFQLEVPLVEASIVRLTFKCLLNMVNQVNIMMLVCNNTEGLQ